MLWQASCIFFHPHGPGCADCHRIDGRGRAIGPSFVRLDGRLAIKRRQLVSSSTTQQRHRSFQLPSLSDPDCRWYRCLRLLQARKQDSRNIDSQGIILKFKIDEIEQMHPSKSSIMPDGLSQSMTLQELKDVLAYLLEPVK
ncbi:MAG: c-type cytochrome [Pirellulaceae bacterium]